MSPTVGGKQDDITVVAGIVAEQQNDAEDIREGRQRAIDHLEGIKRRMQSALERMERRRQLRAKVDTAFEDAVRETENAVETRVEGSSGPAFSEDEVEGMDKARLRRELAALGLPTSGRVERLRERLLAVTRDQLPSE